MTDSQARVAIANDASVIQAHTDFTKTPPQPPSGVKLAAIAKRSLAIALGMALSNQAISKRLLSGVYDLSTIAGTTKYELPNHVGVIRKITDPSRSNAPKIMLFDNPGDFDDWRARMYGSMESTNRSLAAYVEGRTAAGMLQLVFWPGVGDGGTVTLRIEKVVRWPYSIGLFDSKHHGAMVVGGINVASGFKMNELWGIMLSDVARGVDPIVGGTTKIQLGARERRMLRNVNAVQSGSSRSSSLHYGKTR